MVGAAITLLRSAACRSKAPVQAGARAMRQLHPQPQPLPRPRAGLPSPRLFHHGEHPRGQDQLPPMAASSRLFCSGTYESLNKNPSSTEPAGDVEACTNKQGLISTLRKYIEEKKQELRKQSHNMQVAGELKEQIEAKKEELFRLLLQMDPERSVSESQKYEQGKEQLVHLLQEFQAKTQGHKSVSGFVKFVNLVTFVVVMLFAMNVPRSN